MLSYIIMQLDFVDAERKTTLNTPSQALALLQFIDDALT